MMFLVLLYHNSKDSSMQKKMNWDGFFAGLRESIQVKENARETPLQEGEE